MTDAAVATIVSGCITIAGMIVGFLTMWFKVKYSNQSVEEKVDANTRVTKEGTTAATEHAKEATEAAKSVATTTDTINRKLNGGLHAAIHEIIDPVREVDMKSINQKFDGLTAYVHERNHDILNAVQLLTNKMSILTEAIVRREIEEAKKAGQT